MPLQENDTPLATSAIVKSDEKLAPAAAPSAAEFVANSRDAKGKSSGSKKRGPPHLMVIIFGSSANLFNGHAQGQVEGQLAGRELCKEMS